jgi:hypothetical protein
MEDMAPELPASQIKVQLTEDDCTTQPFETHFICSICTLVVQKPKQCSECENLNCEPCIAQWLEKSKHCPSCRQDYTSQKVNRFVMNQLDSIDFRCSVPGCSNTFKYQDAQKHLASHQ